MPELLFKLRNVPDDEIEEIRALLNERSIDFYETAAGSWGISMPGIWLNDDRQLKEAQSLIKVYQRERTTAARASYEQLKQEGGHQTVFNKIMENPARFLMLLFAVLFILYVSLSPFLDFGR
ncbi:MAG: DUF6164 family protein [Mariprofundaceae bacterium]